MLSLGSACSRRACLARHRCGVVNWHQQASPSCSSNALGRSPAPSLGHHRPQSIRCNSFDRGGDGKGVVRFNPVYAGISAGYAGLMLFQNPYIFAALTILTIMPQNSSTTSLNSLVLLFYDSGLFMNFAGWCHACRGASPCTMSPNLVRVAISAQRRYTAYAWCRGCQSDAL